MAFDGEKFVDTVQHGVERPRRPRILAMMTAT